MIDPPPPPPPPHALNEEREAVPAAPKKPWSKPTIRRIENGALVTYSGPNVSAFNPESNQYSPSS